MFSSTTYLKKIFSSTTNTTFLTVSVSQIQMMESTCISQSKDQHKSTHQIQ